VDSPPETSFWERGEGIGEIWSSDPSLCERGEGRGGLELPKKKTF